MAAPTIKNPNLETIMHDHSDNDSLAAAAAKGAIAGLIGGIALLATEQAARRSILPTGSATRSQAAQAVDAVASRHDRSPSPAAGEIIGGALQLAWCAALGAAFGVVHSRVRVPALVDGLALSALAYVTTSSSKGAVARAGAAPPLQQNVEEAAIPIVSHLAFGLATAAVFEATT
jgi:hypothetical protein